MEDKRRGGPTIALVGPNGSGKSTLARRLAEDLRRRGKAVTWTREPGGSPGAEEIRRLVLEGPTDRWSAWSETLLFMAARRDHLEKTIWPALVRGEVVVTDRYLDDTRVFQWFKDATITSALEKLVTSFEIPEAVLTILVDVDPHVAAERISKATGRGADRFEGDPIADRAYRGRYLVLAAENRQRMVTIDGNEDPDEVYESLKQAINNRFNFGL